MGDTFRLLAGPIYLDVYWPYGIYTSIVYYTFKDILLIINNDHILQNVRFPITEDDCHVHARKIQFCDVPYCTGSLLLWTDWPFR